MSTEVWHRGGCHCGKVQIEVLAPEDIEAFRCNCSICAMTGYQHLIVPRSHLRLLAGRDDLSTYRFNTGTAQHYFCKHCGIKPYYVPRSHPDGYSVNARCLDTASIHSLSISDFDGRNWERNVARIRAEDQGE